MKRNNFLLAAVFMLIFLISTTAWSQPQPPVLNMVTSGTWVNLFWTQVPGATSYYLTYAPIPYTGVEPYGTIDMGKRTGAVFSLWEGAAFYLAIQAGDGSELSPYSNIREIVVGNLSPLLDSRVIPKYQEFLIIPPVMPPVARKADLPLDQRLNTPWDSKYEIAVKQFAQQILPAPFPKTTVWSYGNLNGPAPGQPGSTFNYPAFTVEVRRDEVARVTWTNGLVDESGKYLPHLLPVDRTLHWANPELLRCVDGGFHSDCRPDPSALYNSDNLGQLYQGPVPMVTHVHGAHVDAISDGYPEAWWLPAASNIPSYYALKGNNYRSLEPFVPGQAVFEYDNSQPAGTLWYHDHTVWE